MYSTKKLTMYCALAFFLGGGIFGGLASYGLWSSIKVSANLEMVEAFSLGTAMVAHFQNGQPEYVHDFMILSLESSCKAYTSPEMASTIDQEHAKSLVKEAQEVTGLCKN